MKQFLKAKYLPALVAVLGAVGLVLRLELYASAVDGKDLLVPGHPLELLVLGLSALVMALIVITVWPLYGSLRYSDNFPASKIAAAGSAAAALGIVLTVLTAKGEPGRLFQVWKILGLVAGICLALAAYCRLVGKRPVFFLHGGVTVFLLSHLICNYQSWSINPQLQDYIFSLFASVAVMVFSYYHTAFDVGSGKRRTMLAAGLAAGYFSLVALSGSDAPLLYGGCAIWALTDLCSLTPVRRRPNPVMESE